MNKLKYELLSNDKKIVAGVELFRIRALISFGYVKAGDIGGYIQSEKNLSHIGDAWVYNNASVYGDANVYCNANVYGNASVSDNAWVSGDARVYGNARVYGDASVSGNARVSGNTSVYGTAWVYDNAGVSGYASVYGNASISGDTSISGDASVSGNADYITVIGFGTRYRTTTFFRCKDNKVCVNCGCFYGTLYEFRDQVENTRSGKIAEEYLMLADLIEYHFK